MDTLEEYGIPANHPWLRFYTEGRAIPPKKCVERHVYKLHARNLMVGVYVTDGNHGCWRGIREKFNSHFLDTEYPGSCLALEDMGIVVPDSIPLSMSLGTICSRCKRDVEFVSDTPGIHTPGTWLPKDGSPGCPDAGNPKGYCFPLGVSNKALFDFMAKSQGIEIPESEEE